MNKKTFLHHVALLRRVGGDRAGGVAAGRLLANAQGALAAVLDAGSRPPTPAAAGRPGLAIQDSSELCFTTTAQRGPIVTRDGTPQTPPPDRPLAERDSLGWLTTARTGRTVLAPAARVTVVADRQSDLDAEGIPCRRPPFLS